MSGLELLRIRGIPLKIHPSWFVILILFTWSSQDQISSNADIQLSVWGTWIFGFVTSLLLFLSVLLHELGHSFVAIGEGVKVQSITLFLLGGIARVEKECSTPMSSLRVAIAGPLVSLFLGIFLLGGIYFNPWLPPLMINLFGQLGTLNLVLCIFNLLPGLPLDGGLIVKALVWQFTGSQRKGIKFAAVTGRNLSLILIFIGSFICFRSSSFGGLWLVVLGWFGFSTSRSQSQLLILQQVLSDIKVSASFGRDFRVVEDDQSLKSLSQLRVFSSNINQIADWVLVCKSGRWVGHITEKSLLDLPIQEWEKHFVYEYIIPLNELPLISEKVPLWKAILQLEDSEDGRLLVLNMAGLPCGTLDRSDVGNSVLNKLGIKLPEALIKSSKKNNSYPLGLLLPEVVKSMLSAGLVNPSPELTK